MIDLDVSLHDFFVLLEKLHRDSTSFAEFASDLVNIGIRSLLDNGRSLIGRTGYGSAEIFDLL